VSAGSVPFGARECLRASVSVRACARAGKVNRTVGLARARARMRVCDCYPTRMCTVACARVQVIARECVWARVCAWE
jgi:hypothetical protein